MTFREGWTFRPMDDAVATGKIELVGHAGEWRLYRNLARDEAPAASDELEP